MSRGNLDDPRGRDAATKLSSGQDGSRTTMATAGISRRWCDERSGE